MQSQPVPFQERVADRLLLAASVVYIVLYVVIALMRMNHPFELEWMEGAMVDHVRRVLEGRPLYAQPSLDFTAFIYTPLFYWLSALMATITGLGFFPLRLVSFLGSLAGFGVLGLWAGKRTGSRAAGFVAAGLMAGSYQCLDAWYDIGRVDMVWLALLLGGIYLVRDRLGAARAFISIALIVLSFLAKQTTLLVMLPVLVGIVWRDKRRGILYAVVLATAISVTVFAYDALTDGWFSFYTFTLPAEHAIAERMVPVFLFSDLRPLWPLILASGWLLYRGRRNLLHEPDRFLLLAGVGLAVGGMASRLHVGGFPNVVIPTFAGLILLGATWYGLSRRDHDRARDASSLPSQRIMGWALVLSFVMMVHDPRDLVPTAADRQTGQIIVDHIGRFDGDVLVFSHGHLTTMAGKPVHAHKMSIYDLLRGDIPASTRQEFLTHVEDVLASGEYSAIILDDDWSIGEIAVLVDRYYEVGELLALPDGQAWQKCGYRVLPASIRVPRDARLIPPPPPPPSPR